MDETDKTYYWNDEDFLAQSEREAKREFWEEKAKQKEDNKKRKPGEIPTYTKMRKEGMAREQQITDKWNKKFSGKTEKPKKFNVKQRLSFDDEDEEVSDEITTGIEVHDNFSAEIPKTFVSHAPKSEAKRRPNSGAMWHAKGDISLENALIEVKERGTLNARGKKTISIPKEWLTKQADEAYLEGKEHWYLAFAYKGDDDVYLISSYDQEMDLIYELRRLEAENKHLRDLLGKND